MEAALAVVPENNALTTIAVRYKKIKRTIAIEISGDDGSSGSG
jgi:hypothetical protein